MIDARARRLAGAARARRRQDDRDRLQLAEHLEAPRVSPHPVDDDRPRARADLPRARLPRRRHQPPRRLGHDPRHADRRVAASGAPIEPLDDQRAQRALRPLPQGDRGQTPRSTARARAWFKQLEDGDAASARAVAAVPRRLVGRVRRPSTTRSASGSTRCAARAPTRAISPRVMGELADKGLLAESEGAHGRRGSRARRSRSCSSGRRRHDALRDARSSRPRSTAGTRITPRARCTSSIAGRRCTSGSCSSCSRRWGTRLGARVRARAVRAGAHRRQEDRRRGPATSSCCSRTCSARPRTRVARRDRARATRSCRRPSSRASRAMVGDRRGRVREPRAAARARTSTSSWRRRSSLDGDSGPYLQYSHARCASIVRKAGERGRLVAGVDFARLATDAEWAVARRLLDFPDVVVRAAAACEPHVDLSLPARARGRRSRAGTPRATATRRCACCATTRRRARARLALVGAVQRDAARGARAARHRRARSDVVRTCRARAAACGRPRSRARASVST